jgi:hypothetical protein
MSGYLVTIGPESPDDHPDAVSATLIVDAVDERAARHQAEVTYRREHPTVGGLRLRVTLASGRRPWSGPPGSWAAI